MGYPMVDPTFRVVLTGELATGYGREAAVAALGRLFERTTGEITRLLDAGDCQVGPAVTAEEALGLQERLEEAGARVRVERLGQNTDPLSNRLPLPSSRDALAGLMHCPACGHEQLVSDRCDVCGVVFSEFNRTRRHTQRPHSAPMTHSTPAPQRPLAHDDWRDDWVDEGDDTPTEDYHLKLYMGLHGEHLLEPCRHMSVGSRVVPRPSWLWGAVFSPFLWALYRKMWGWALLLFVVDLFVPVLFILLGAKEGISDKLVYLGILMLGLNRLVWPAVLKFLYCRHARGMVAYLNRMSPTFASDIDVATRGGTSRTAVFAGLVASFVILLLSWSIIDTLHSSFMHPAPSFVPSARQESVRPSGPETSAADRAATRPVTVQRPESL